MGSTHAVMGAFTTLAVAAFSGFQPVEAMALAGIGALAALVPDIDHPGSTVRQRMGLAGAVLFWLPHRGITHTLWAALAVTLAAFHFLPGPLAGALMAGYCSHLLGDMLTVRGLPLLWPLSSHRFYLLPRPLRLVAGGFVETVIIYHLIFVSLILVMLWMILDGR